MNKIFAPDLFIPKRIRLPGYTQARERYLRDHQGIDVAILAADLGLTERYVIQFQRYLGLRKLTSPSAKRNNRFD